MPAMGRRPTWTSSVRAALLAGALRAGGLALAGPPPPNPPAAAGQPSADKQPSDPQRADKEMELRGVEDTLRQSEEQRRAIETEIDSVRADRARLSRALIQTTAKVQDAEGGASACSHKLSGLNIPADTLTR